MDEVEPTPKLTDETNVPNMQTESLILTEIVMKGHLATFQIAIFKKWLLMMMQDPQSQEAKVKALKMTSQVIYQFLHEEELLEEETLPLHLTSKYKPE